MEKKKFLPINLKRLRNDDLLSLCEKTSIMIKSFGKITDITIVNILKKLDADAEQYRVRINPKRGSLLTQKIEVLDRKREIESREIVRRTQYFLKQEDPFIQAAAQIFNMEIKAYRSLQDHPMDTKATVTGSFLQAIDKDENLKTAIETLELATLVGKLSAINQEFDKLWLERSLDWSVPKGPSGLEVRATMINTYVSLCQTVVTIMQFNSTNELELIFDRINEYRREYANLLRRRFKPEEKEEKIKRPKKRKISRKRG